MSQLQYSVGAGSLTLEQRNFYEENGFVVVKDLVPKGKLDQYINRFKDICNGAKRSPGLTIMKDISNLDSNGEQAIYKLQDFTFDPALFDYCRLPQVLDCVESLIGHDIMAMHTMLISKPPDRGTLSSRHPLHQDLHYFPFRPANRIACAWTALEPVSRENGCLVVLPGTHRGKLLPHDYPKWEGRVNKAFHGIVDVELDTRGRVHLPMSAGDTVLFHPLLIHGSGANRTSGYRKAISCHYAAGDVKFIDVSGTSQRSIVEEVAGIVRRRYGDEVKLDYADLWRMRATTVRGREARL